jgi:GNAT superfamily N-acetyltransferase
MKDQDQILAGQEACTIRQLSGADEDILQALCLRCADYTRIVEGREPPDDAAKEILDALPPGKEYEDKFVLGAFARDGTLIAVIDLVRDYKSAGEWMIGLLMIDPVWRGSGLGTHLHTYIRERVLAAGGGRLRIGVVAKNTGALHFWTKTGYREIGRVEATYGEKTQTIIIMVYDLV